ncbi:type II toxin-antitoxin system HigB family toxin [Flammeovirga pectinis]|uniref:Type II toxin-antitoxin system HigB family toxin n=1 Tax=Flammeovirga pectinis TaxID=2494373 RepID=A0A3Q9FQN1_9BACT|nr:type II toxin-antitoxin system HigB family toxin [Flammeovirga pectinis]AZQ63736.1 type II toxin-antitoxin system HigB family toxin [Flammeovirga pectinis]
MKRIISKKTLIDFANKHASSKQVLELWYDDVKSAKWINFNDIIYDYPSADVLNNHRVCFNIGGNKFRLIATINFRFSTVRINFIGTHAEYDKIKNASTIEKY